MIFFFVKMEVKFEGQVTYWDLFKPLKNIYLPNKWSELL